MLENFRQIHERVSDRLLDISPDYEQVQLNFHLTSVYDHSLHEAFSKVLHKLIDSLPYLEELLNVFCAVRNALSLLRFVLNCCSRIRSRRKRSYSIRNRGCTLRPMLHQWILPPTTFVVIIYKLWTPLERYTSEVLSWVVCLVPHILQISCHEFSEAFTPDATTFCLIYISTSKLLDLHRTDVTRGEHANKLYRPSTSEGSFLP